MLTTTTEQILLVVTTNSLYKFKILRVSERFRLRIFGQSRSLSANSGSIKLTTTEQLLLEVASLLNFKIYNLKTDYI